MSSSGLVSIVLAYRSLFLLYYKKLPAISSVYTLARYGLRSSISTYIIPKVCFVEIFVRQLIIDMLHGNLFTVISGFFILSGLETKYLG